MHNVEQRDDGIWVQLNLEGSLASDECERQGWLWAVALGWWTPNGCGPACDGAAAARAGSGPPPSVALSTHPAS